jgi:hypothetical protein
MVGRRRMIVPMPICMHISRSWGGRRVQR